MAQSGLSAADGGQRGRAAMASRDPRAWVGVLLASVVIALVVVGVALQLGAAPPLEADLTVGDRVAPLTFALFAAVAGLVTARRPGLVVGWLLLAFAGLMALNGAATGTAHSLVDRPGATLDAAAWMQSWVWVPAITVLAIALSLFPDGHLPSRRWRHLVRLQVVGLGIACLLGTALWPHRGPSLLLVDDQWPGAAGTIGGVALPVAFVGFVVALASLVVRYRTAGPLVRQQLKWLLFAVALLVTALLLAAVADVAGHGEQWWQDLFGVTGLLLLPVSIGAAVLRYRLFEIDRIISRTLAWLLVTVMLGGLYGVGVLLLGAMLPTGGGDAVVALSTLAVAALFQPLRGRVQRLVDRRFDRGRYDASRTIDAFGRRLRDEVSREAVVAGLRRVAVETFGAVSVGVVLTPEERP